MAKTHNDTTNAERYRKKFVEGMSWKDLSFEEGVGIATLQRTVLSYKKRMIDKKDSKPAQ